jgi:hypothetical protein
MPEKTMIRILKDTAERLKKLSLYERETYDEIIQRLLDAAQLLEQHKAFERETYVETITRLLEIQKKNRED